MKIVWLSAATVMLVLSACRPAAARKPLDREAQIRLALSAAPAAIAARATVASMEGGGQLRVLRGGDNGWTCVPPNPGGAGADPEPEPACFDANGLAFMEAFGAGRYPDANKPGFSYMLQGGSAWSNVDPAATKLPAGEKDYIHIPPHIMILDAKMANESGLPLHEEHPDTRQPFVMFGATPFAILIIPVR